MGAIERRRGAICFAAGLLAALGLGWIAFPRAIYQKTAQPVSFSHKIHTGEKGGMKCEDCHTLREDGVFAGIPPLEKCAGCHSAPLGNTPEEKKFVEKYVTPNRPLVWQVYARQPENVYFPHAVHMKRAGLKCERCHDAQGTTDTLRVAYTDRITGYSHDVWQKMRMDDCVACHRSHGLEHSCLDCHK